MGVPVAFTPFTLPLLSRPDERLFLAINTQEEWAALLERLAPIPSRPGGSQGRTGESVLTATPQASRPGSRVGRTAQAETTPNFRRDVMFLVMLEKESPYRSVKIVDVRKSGRAVYIYVQLSQAKPAPGQPSWAAAAVTVQRKSLPQTPPVQVLFVNETGEILHTTNLLKR